MRKQQNTNREECIVRMPKALKKEKKILRRKKRFQLKNLFSKRNSSKSLRRGKFNIKLLILPIFFFSLSVMFLALRYVLRLRGDITEGKEHEITQILGLDNIPSLEGSTFLFADNLDSPIVKEFFLEVIQYIFYLRAKSSKDVENYYLDKLKKLGWEYIESVAIGTVDKKYGQYWVKDGKGLRIYTNLMIYGTKQSLKMMPELLYQDWFRKKLKGRC